MSEADDPFLASRGLTTLGGRPCRFDEARLAPSAGIHALKARIGKNPRRRRGAPPCPMADKISSVLLKSGFSAARI